MSKLDIAVVSISILILAAGWVVFAIALQQEYLVFGQRTLPAKHDSLLTFDESVVKELQNHWRENPDSEYGACLSGTTDLQIKGDEYENFTVHIDTVDRFFEGKRNYVPAFTCPDESMVKVHSHPNSGCRDYLWSGDVTPAKEAFEDGIIYYAIHCEEDAIEIYNRNNLYKGLVVQI